MSHTIIISKCSKLKFCAFLCRFYSTENNYSKSPTVSQLRLIVTPITGLESQFDHYLPSTKPLRFVFKLYGYE